MKKQVNFNGFKCDVDISKRYNNNRRAIILTDSEDGTGVVCATINVPMEELEEDEVIIKDYSENDGILDVLIDANIVSEPVDYARVSKFVEAPICKLLNL